MRSRDRWSRPLPALALVAVLLLPQAAGARSRGFVGSRAVQMEDYLPHLSGAEGYSEQWSFSHELGKERRLSFQIIISNAGIGDHKGAFKLDFSGVEGKPVKLRKRCKVKARRVKGRVVIGCGGLQVSADQKGYVARVRSKDFSMEVWVSSQVPPWRPGDGRVVYDDQGKDFYDLLIAVPRGRVRGKVRQRDTEQEIEGTAFADHSYSTVGPHEVAESWLRLKHMSPERTLLLATLRTPDDQRYGYVLIADEAGRVLATASPGIELSETFAAPNRKKYSLPRTLRVTTSEGRDSLDIRVRDGKVVKVKDMLSGLNRVERFVAKRFTDPFGYSMKGSFLVEWKRGGTMHYKAEQEGSFLVEHLNP